MEQAQSHLHETAQSTSYTRMVGRALALGTLAFAVLFAVSVVFLLLGDDVRRAAYLRVGWHGGMAMILALSVVLRAHTPRLAFWGGTLGFIGSASQLAAEAVDVEQSLLRQLGFDVFWDTTQTIMPPITWWGITVLLWMVGLVILGVGVIESKHLPRWIGVLLVVATLGYFIGQGPGGYASLALVPIGYTVSAVAFLAVAPALALHTWRDGPN